MSQTIEHPTITDTELQGAGVQNTELQSVVHAALQPGTATEVTITAREHTFTIDEPADLGGTDRGANPVEHLLAALASCTVITYTVWAEKLGLRLEGVEVDVDGTIDLRGFLGLDVEVRAGFQGINLGVRLTGPESAEDYRRLEKAVGAHCPVGDNLTAGVPLRTHVTLAG